MQPKSQADAYLTVYLSLIIPVILGLILALLQGARLGAVKMKSELAADISVNSVLGEYNREFFDRYSLLFIEDSFGTSNGSILNVQEHLSKYFTKNFELSPIGLVTRRSRGINARLDDMAVTGYSLASDGDGAVLRRQIVAYMEAGPVTDVISKVEGNVQELREQGYDSLDVDELSSQNSEVMSGSYSIDSDNDGEAEQYGVDNPAGAVSATKSIGVLPLAAPDLDSLSEASINTDKYISKRDRRRGSGLDESEKSGVISKSLFNQYLFEKCGCYGREDDESVLKYELEYLYAGKNSDYENLNKVVNALFAWREASNFIYLMSDSEKIAEAEALALTASILLLVPELEEAIKMAVILAWTFAETISDLRILLSNGKVPLVKTAEDWKLSLEGMLEYRDNLTEGGGRGLSYEDYLKMLIIMKSEKVKTFRLMDLMEMNIRQSEGNQEFRMDNCIDVFRANFKVSGNHLQNYEIERVAGYEQS